MGLVVLLPDLDALQEKGEAETLYLDGPSNLLGALIWIPVQISQDRAEGCPLHNVDTHWKGQVQGQSEQVTTKLSSSWHE